MVNIQNTYDDDAPGTLTTEMPNDVVADDDKIAAPFPGPLMHYKMQKEDLIRYIQHTAQTFLKKKTRGHNEAYFYWQIMDLFCCHNGTVMMAQVATLLYEGYDLLRKKGLNVKDSEKLKAWCFPLAQLLCSSASDDEHREAVIKMGDDLAKRGCTYAAHICYVVAKVDLGTRDQFELIGCNRFPFGLSAMDSAVQRTEVYEYVLSLTSGWAQPNFQMVKLCYANRLALLDFRNEALNYCETIANAVITFPCSIRMNLYERLILLTDHVLEGGKEPAWLLEVDRLKVKVAGMKANANPEQHSQSTNSTVESEGSENHSIRVSLALDCPDYQCHDLQCHDLNPEVAFESRYTLGKLLGKGAFGSVYAGIRREDNKEVAIKIVRKNPYLESMVIPGTTRQAPVEVVLMQVLSEPPCCSNIVQLFEWFELADRIVMVLEKPSHCLDLSVFVTRQGGRLTEAQARDIMLQVIRAARHCRDRGVLHRDIKAENLIINTQTLEVKLTDFGCGALLKDAPYTVYAGTFEFSPPELELDKFYMGTPSTVWGLGILMFSLVCGELPFQSVTIFEEDLKLCSDVSQDLFDLLMWCLDLEPNFRPSFEEITSHEWFTEAV